MRIKFRKNSRRGIIILFLLLVLGSAGWTAWWYQQAETKVEEVPVFSHEHTATVDYQVYFHPNEFFPEVLSAPSGLAYITLLTDYINTVFTYSFAASEEVEIMGDYEVVAVLNAAVMVGERDARERITVWEVREVLVPTTPFTANDQILEIEQQIPVILTKHAEFAELVRTELRFSPEVIDLSIIYNINVEAVSAHGTVSETLTPVMIFPVGGNVFSVDGRLTDSKEGMMTTSRIIDLPEVPQMRQIAAITTGVLFFLFLLSVFLTTAIPETLAEKKLLAIMKKYGERIVASRGLVPFASRENMMSMNSFEDLLKVADEVGQPILYEVAETDKQRKHSFYVITATLAYVFSMEEAVEEIVADKTDKTEKGEDKTVAKVESALSEAEQVKGEPTQKM